MATSSILKQVVIDTPEDIERFVDALEEAEGKETENLNMKED